MWGVARGIPRKAPDGIAALCPLRLVVGMLIAMSWMVAHTGAPSARISSIVSDRLDEVLTRELPPFYRTGSEASSHGQVAMHATARIAPCPARHPGASSP